MYKIRFQRAGPAAGFTLVELMIVIMIGIIVTLFGLPSLTKTQAAYRASGNGRAIAEMLALAKMRAGANFTKEQVVFDTTSNTYHLEQYDKTSSAFVADGGTEYLSSGVSFGYGSITAEAGTQTTMTQSSPITFNSRGIPINGSNQPTGEGAIYYYNSSGYFAVTVGLNSRIQEWKWVNSAWVAQ